MYLIYKFKLQQNILYLYNATCTVALQYICTVYLYSIRVQMTVAIPQSKSCTRKRNKKKWGTGEIERERAILHSTENRAVLYTSPSIEMYPDARFFFSSALLL